MDLSEGSDAEDEGQGSGYYVNEDDLLEGSDEEEPAPVKEDRQVVPYSRGLNEEEDLLYSDDEDDGEFLDLRAGDDDDELGLANDSGAVAEGIDPVKVPIRTTETEVEEESSIVYEADEAGTAAAAVTPTEEFEDNHQVETEREREGESHFDESRAEKTDDTNDEEDDEDEEEGKTQRSRFHSERKPITSSENFGNSFMGKPQPIRSLGYQHNNRGNMHHQNHQGQRNWGPQNGPRQFHRGFNNHHRGQRPPQHMMMHRMQMHRNGMLGPRPEMMQHHQGPGPRLLGHPGVHHPGAAPVVQFSSEIFTDFNTPVRPPGPNNHNRPAPQNQQPPVPGSQIPTVQVNPVARPGVGIVRPQPVANVNPNNKPGQNVNKPMQAQAQNQQSKQSRPAAPQTQKPNNPFFSQQHQNQGPRNSSQGTRPVWKGRLRPPVPQNNPIQMNNNTIRPPHPQFPGPIPPGPFDQSGNNVGLGPGPNRFGPPGNNLHMPIPNLQPPGAEAGPLMNNGPTQGFGGPPIRQPSQQGPPQPPINPNPFLQRPNRPFLGSPQPQQGQGMIPVMQQHGQMPVQMQPRSPFDHFPGQNAPRLMGHPYPPDPEFRHQAPVAQRAPCPEMYNMVPPPHQQFGQRFGGIQQEPMFNPNQQSHIRHQYFGEPQQPPQQFHPDPNMMNYMQGPPGGFSQYAQQFQQPMPIMNTMNHGVQALSLNNHQTQYGSGGYHQSFHTMDQRDRDREELEERYGVKLPFKRKKDNKTLSEEFIAFNNPAKHQRLHDRLGPPPARKTEIYNQDQADEIVKIIVETKKEMGIDDDYMKQIEEQKRKRAEILKLKAERMRSSKEDDSGSGPKQSRHDDSRSKPQSALRTVRKVEETGPESRKSIYINPAAFKGDLSVLNNNLRRINMSISSDSMSQQSTSSSRTSAQAFSRVASSRVAPSSSVSGSQARSSTTTSTGRTVITSPREASPKVEKKKSKTILRVTKNRKGEVLYMEKLAKAYAAY